MISKQQESKPTDEQDVTQPGEQVNEHARSTTPDQQQQPIAPRRNYKKIMPDLIDISRAFGKKKLPDKKIK